MSDDERGTRRDIRGVCVQVEMKMHTDEDAHLGLLGRLARNLFGLLRNGTQTNQKPLSGGAGGGKRRDIAHTQERTLPDLLLASFSLDGFEHLAWHAARALVQWEIESERGGRAHTE